MSDDFKDIYAKKVDDLLRGNIEGIDGNKAMNRFRQVVEDVGRKMVPYRKYFEKRDKYIKKKIESKGLIPKISFDDKDYDDNDKDYGEFRAHYDKAAKSFYDKEGDPPPNPSRLGIFNEDILLARFSDSPEEMLDAQYFWLAVCHDANKPMLRYRRPLIISDKMIEMLKNKKIRLFPYYVYADQIANIEAANLWLKDQEEFLGFAYKAVVKDLKKCAGSKHNENKQQEKPVSSNIATKLEDIDDEALLSPAKIAEIYGVPKEALRKRLERLRKKDMTCFIEDAERGLREARFLYKAGKIRAIVKKLQPKSSD